MQFFKPALLAAILSLALCPFFVPAAQQPTPPQQSKPPEPKPPQQSPPAGGKSESSVSVPAVEPPKESEDARSNDAIRVSVNEVIVPITVTDEKGKFVTNLKQGDFQVFEENKLQNVRFFTAERNQPVVVGFLLDMSTASRIHWQNFQNATEELIQVLMTGDPKHSGFLIDFAQDAEIAVETTSNPDPLVEKIRKLKPGGGAAMYDAIYLACTRKKLVKGEPIEPRRVIVIVGDGHDNASKHSREQVIELAQRNQFTIFCISTQAFGFTSETDDNLVKLARETGGRVVYPLGDVYKDTDGYLSHPSDDGNYALTVGVGAYQSVVDNKMYRAVSDIAGEVTTQYIIRYVSDNPTDKAFRNVKVVVDLGNVKVRARKGYYPGAATP
jgi:Ca-activated chloride channel family protein